MAIDAIGEIFNISLGSSATAVSNMLARRVDITTPTVTVVAANDFCIDDIKPAIGVKIDYVAGWYFKAAQLMMNTTIRTAFVSTNSITQGEQVAGVWKPLYERFGIHIDFAHRTFHWDSEASIKAHVHCVIVGFSIAPNSAPRVIYTSDRNQVAENINGYLIDAPTVFIENRAKPLCNVLQMTSGNRPADGGHLIVEEDEYDDFVKNEPNAIPYLRRLSGATEFINNKKRWCLWLVDISPSELRKMPYVMERVEKCRLDRLNGAADRQNLLIPLHYLEKQRTQKVP